MTTMNLGSEPTARQLLAIIKTQTEIAKLGLDLSAVMTLVAEQSQVITHAAGAVVELAEGDDMVYRAVAGSASGLLGLRLKRKTSLSGLSVATAATLYCEDSESDPRVDRNACRTVGLRSMVVVPLIHHGEAVGVLKVVSPQPCAFGGAEIRILGLMSELIAAAMFHATKYGADQLFRLATTDNLTGLANRALFLDRLRNDLGKAKRDGRCVAVLMIDMDGLKSINDAIGHGAGDAAIKEVATRIVSQCRQTDTVARFGGDEFAAILSPISERNGVTLVARSIATRCDEPFTFDGKPLKISASIGFALHPDDASDPGSLIEKADQCMYQEKRGRKQGERGATSTASTGVSAHDSSMN